MALRYNTFTRIIIFIILILIPIIVLYAVSNQVSMTVLKNEVRSLKQQDVKFFANELDSSLNNISTLGFLLGQDIHIQKIRTLHLLSTNYERYAEKLRILERLQLLNAAGKWDTQFSILSPENQEMVSTSVSLFDYNLDVIVDRFSPEWDIVQLKKTSLGFKEERFYRHLVRPMDFKGDLSKSDLIVEMSFNKEELTRDLDSFKFGGKGDPFLLNPNGAGEIITNKTANMDMIEELIDIVQDNGIDHYENEIVKLQGSEYLVNSKAVHSLGWYVVDYVPLDAIVKPIITSRNLFYGSIVLLLVMSLYAAYMLYKNVQRPILQLVRSVHKLKIGDYSARIEHNSKNEFNFLFDRFNEMAAEMEQLIQKVYVEQIRSREANLKQLQSQINPHFLYNCFALIRSLTRLGKTESVMDLALHLSKYYRYTTRVEKQIATLQEELSLIDSYLRIQQLHISHLQYEIDVPTTMLDLEIPRLLLQPLVENAVLHGIELAEWDGLITISGKQTEQFNVLNIIDNGIGMTAEQLAKLENDMANTPNEETGTALWNIKQRLKLQFGNRAELSFQSEGKQGVKVEIKWPRAANTTEIEKI